MEKKHNFYNKVLKILLKKIFENNGNSQEQLKLKDMCTFKGGYSFKEKYQGHTNLPIPFYKVSDLNLNQKYMEKVNNTVDLDFVQEMKYNLINKPSVLIAKLGEAIFLERKRITTTPCLIDNNLLSCIPIDENNLDLLYYLMLNTNISRLAQQTAVPSLSPKDIGDIKIFVPINDIKRKISINLLKNVDKKIENIGKEIELNKEFKRSLLSKMFC